MPCPSNAKHPSLRRYDTLVFAAGSTSTTFNLPGVAEHARFLKCAADAAAIRAHVHDQFERASLPRSQQQQRPQQRAMLEDKTDAAASGARKSEPERDPNVDDMLRFVICGGGPTGAELAAELRDLIDENLRALYPALAPRASVVVVDSGCHILSSFDRTIAEYATEKFQNDGIRLVLKVRARVEIKPL
jgi:NADH:ubiquinone reductase (non-electrogenic)